MSCGNLFILAIYRRLLLISRTLSLLLRVGPSVVRSGPSVLRSITMHLERPIVLLHVHTILSISEYMYLE